MTLVFDTEAFAHLTFNDTVLQRQMAAAFARESRQIQEELTVAVDESAARVAWALHRLLGSTRYVAGERLAQWIGSPDIRSGQWVGDSGQVAGFLSRLDRELEELRQALQAATAHVDAQHAQGESHAHV